MSSVIPVQFPAPKTRLKPLPTGASMRVPDPLPTEVVDRFAWYPCCPVCQKPVRVLVLDGITRCAHCFVIWSHVPATATPDEGE